MKMSITNRDLDSFNSLYFFHWKGDNLRRVDTQIGLKPFDGDFGLNNDVGLLIDLCARQDLYEVSYD